MTQEVTKLRSSYLQYTKITNKHFIFHHVVNRYCDTPKPHLDEAK